MKDELVFFKNCSSLKLEGRLSTPEINAVLPAVLVCHPHPLYGGNMDNNVVTSICDKLAQESFITMRFNLRGVGKSEGHYSQGGGEQEDVKAALSFLASYQKVDVRRLGLVGYSAGGAYGLPVAVSDEKVKAMSAVSPPLSMSDFAFLTASTKPKLLVTGSVDDFTGLEQFMGLYERCEEPKEHLIVEGAGHFWWGKEHVLAEAVAKFFIKLSNAR